MNRRAFVAGLAQVAARREQAEFHSTATRAAVLLRRATADDLPAQLHRLE